MRTFRLHATWAFTLRYVGIYGIYINEIGKKRVKHMLVKCHDGILPGGDS